jgi:hypothetical protein
MRVDLCLEKAFSGVENDYSAVHKKRNGVGAVHNRWGEKT